MVWKSKIYFQHLTKLGSEAPNAVREIRIYFERLKIGSEAPNAVLETRIYFECFQSYDWRPRMRCGKPGSILRSAALNAGREIRISFWAFLKIALTALNTDQDDVTEYPSNKL